MISEQTLSTVTGQLFAEGKLLPAPPSSDPSWDELGPGAKSEWIAFARKVVAITKLSNEIELRQRLMSPEARKAASTELAAYLPEDFVWPDENNSADVFVLALVAALSVTSAVNEA